MTNRGSLANLTKGLSPFSNAGLLLEKYHTGNNNDEHLKTVCAAVQHASELYKAFYARWEAYLQLRATQSSVKTHDFRCERLVIGLGRESALEIGLTLHPIYGVPYIPGSTIKGLCAHYCDRVVGTKQRQENFRMGRLAKDEEGREVARQIAANGKYYALLFGDARGEMESAGLDATSELHGQSRGFITFYDAYITPGSLQGCLLQDIMTPHHTDYYATKGAIPPTDFDNPIPIPFLSVKGDFLIALGCEDASERGREYLDLAWNLLSAALQEWGAGGKTSSGYGRCTLSTKEP